MKTKIQIDGPLKNDGAEEFIFSCRFDDVTLGRLTELTSELKAEAQKFADKKGGKVSEVYISREDREIEAAVYVTINH